MNGLLRSAVLLTALLCAAWGPRLAAHEGIDHTAGAGLDASAVDAARPRRLPDGGLFVPKPTQHALGVRHVVARLREVPLSVRLNGRVIADPASSGRVQAMQGGRILPPSGGLPLPGQRVARGQVLALLDPAASSIERGDRQERLAQLDAELAIAERRQARYAQLEGVIAQKDIDAARDERDALHRRRTAVAASLGTAQILRAPVSGIIGATNVVAGQVVDAREVLFEIVDPARLAVEAIAYDTALADAVDSASMVLPDARTLPLTFLGGARVLREQALPLLFRVAATNAPLAVGQSLAVIVRTRTTRTGVTLPAAALVRSDAGGDAVWLHDSAERFTLRSVEAQPLDGATVVVTAGLREGERVVTTGASLLAQIH